MASKMLGLCMWSVLVTSCTSLVHVQQRETKTNGTEGSLVSKGELSFDAAGKEDEWLSCELRSEECKNCQARSRSEGKNILIQDEQTGQTVLSAFHDKNHVLKAFDGWVLPVNFRAGEIWLVKTDDIHIQGRGCVSEDFGGAGAGQGAISAVAVGGQFLGGHVIIAETLNGQVSIDDTPVTEGRKAFATMYSVYMRETRTDPEGRRYSDVMAWLPRNTRMLVRRYEHHVDAKIYLSKAELGIEADDLGQLDGKCNSRLDFEKHVDPEYMLFQTPMNIDESGYNMLQARKQPYRMGNFIRQLITTRGAELLDEKALQEQIPVYSGVEASRSWERLLKTLRRAHWVKGFRNKK